MNGVQTRFKCKLDVKRCKRFVFPPSSLLPRSNALKTKAIRYFQTDRTLTRIVSPPLHIVVIFNPADITGLITLLYSGLKPSQVTTLAALDSTRLRSELSKHFGIAMDNVENCRTYGGHGEQMAVYASTAKVNGKALLDIIGTDALTKEQWTEIQQKVTKGGANIINLRGRSSFQSPSYVSIEMIAAAMGGKPFRWPAGTYVSNGKFDHIMMAWETSITKDGCHLKEVKGTPEEEAALEKSYAHLCALRDEVIAMGVLPPVSEWNKLNPYIK